ncbi:UNVERIFIED_CONTAM: protein SMAX1-LIKE 7 [Sesamum latifolium]|uniref:Protein SMAX1-LIKE 7 n=1 Tax=Sesamum latifolium TaxID=2727402 RepID=A0AAW2XKH3_9LAMI
MLGNDKGPGVVVNLGDLKAFAGDGVGIDGLKYLVGKLARLLEEHGGKLWLIGAAATYDVFLKILNNFPSIQKEWDLEILPVTSLKLSMGGSYPRSSLMESFVPLGGFFSMPSDTKSSLSNACQYIARCHQCNEKYKQELDELSNRGVCSPVTNQNQLSFHASSQPNRSNGFAAKKAEDDSLLLNAKTAGLQKKWDTICQQHHYNQPSLKGRSPHLDHQFPRVLGFQVAQEKRENTSIHSSSHSNTSSTEQGNKNVISSLSTDLRQSSSFKEFPSLDMLSKTKNPSILPESIEIPPKFIDVPGGIKSHHFASSSISIGDRASPSSVTSVTTDLGLGIISFSTSQEAEKPVDESHEDLVQDLSGSLSTNADATKSSISNCPSQCSSCSSHDSHARSNMKDPKMIYKALVERVGQQEQAISAAIEAVTQCQKRSTENFIYVDLSFQDEMTNEDAVLNSQVTNKYDFKMRRTVVDYLVEELSKKPCVVFLENIDKSDPVVQNSLSQAVKTGPFDSDIHRIRSQHNPRNENLLQSDPTKTGSSNPNLMNKRKNIRRSTNTDQCGSLGVAKRAHKASNFPLDLNLPAQGSETWESDSDLSSETTSSWLEDFDRQIDRVVVFKPFDFDKLAEKLSADMSECLHGIVGTKCSLEIEQKVMLQLIAAAYLLGNKTVEDWIQHVLKHGFAEAMGKFSLNACSIVKVVAFDGVLGDEHTECLLPASIIVN